MNYRHGIPALLTASALLLAGCSTNTESSAENLEVMASFYPLQFVAERVGGDHVSVANLTPPSAEPHDLELAPAQVRAITSADLVVYLPGFQPAVDEAVTEASADHLLDAASATTLEEKPNGHSPEEHAADPDHGHADDETPIVEEEHAGEEHAGEEHDHGGLDPHFWLDPQRLIPVVTATADKLSSLDPDHQSDYQANAEALVAELTELDSELANTLASCSGATLITAHEAFGYLAQRYDLYMVGIVGLDPEAEPSPARLREVAGIAEEHGVSTIYFESQASSKVSESLAKDLDITASVLDPIETLNDPQTDYLSVMRSNGKSLSQGLVCS